MALQRLGEGSTYDNIIDNGHTWGYDYTQHRMDITPDGQAVGLGTPIPSGGKGLYIDARSSGPTVPCYIYNVSRTGVPPALTRCSYSLDGDVYSDSVNSEYLFSSYTWYTRDTSTRAQKRYELTLRNRGVNANYPGKTCPIILKGQPFTFACNRTGFIHNELIPFGHPQYITLPQAPTYVNNIYDGVNTLTVRNYMESALSTAKDFRVVEFPTGWTTDWNQSWYKSNVTIQFSASSTLSGCNCTISKVQLYKDDVYAIDIYNASATANTAVVVDASYISNFIKVNSDAANKGGTWYLNGWHGSKWSSASSKVTLYFTALKHVYITVTRLPVEMEGTGIRTTAVNTGYIKEFNTPPSYITKINGRELTKYYNVSSGTHTPSVDALIRFTEDETRFGYEMPKGNLSSNFSASYTYYDISYNLTQAQWLDYSHKYGYSECLDNAVGMYSNIKWSIGAEIRYCNWRLSDNLCMFRNWGLTKDSIGELCIPQGASLTKDGTSGYNNDVEYLHSYGSTTPNSGGFHRCSNIYAGNAIRDYITYSTTPFMLAGYEGED